MTGPPAVPDAGPDRFTSAQRASLLGLARRAIGAALSGGRRPDSGDDPALKARRPVFVSLYRGGALRGCLGCLEARFPLDEAVARLAVAAALEDPRFPPLTRPELARVTLEISVLTTPRPVAGPGEIVIPGDGVIVRRGDRQGVFLPQVAVETGWDRAAFLDALCVQKAGLPAGAWRDPDTALHVFRVTVLREEEASR